MAVALKAGVLYFAIRVAFLALPLLQAWLRRV